LLIEKRKCRRVLTPVRSLPRDSLRSQKKVGEEAIEVVLSSGQEKKRSIEESADLLYHLLVFLTQREVTLQEVVEELRSRSRKTG